MKELSLLALVSGRGPTCFAQQEIRERTVNPTKGFLPELESGRVSHWTISITFMALLLSMIPSKASAQVFCGVAVDQGTIAPTSIIQVSSVIGGTRPYWSFTALVGETYTFSTCNGFGPIDTHLRLYDSGNNVVAANDDACSYRSHLIWTAPDNGVYNLLLTNHVCNALQTSGNLAYSSTIQPGLCGIGTGQGTIVPTATLQATTVGSGGRPYWLFTAVAGTSYTFSTCNGFTDDTYLRLHNNAGALVAQSNDGCGTRSHMTWLAPTSGVYSVLLTNSVCNVLQTGGFLEYSSSILPVFCEAAAYQGPIAPTSTVQTDLVPGGIRPFWSFTAVAGNSYTFSTCNGFTGDTYLRLYNSPGTVVAESDDVCGSRSLITWSAPDNGVYSVLLTDPVCNVLATGGYLESSSTLPPVFCGVGAYQGTLAPTSTIQDSFVSGGDRPYWTFFAVAGETYTFSTCAGFPGIDTFLRLYNSSGSEVAGNDDACSYKSHLIWTAPDNGYYNLLLTNHVCNALQTSGNLAYSATVPPGFCGVAADHGTLIPVCSEQTVSAVNGSRPYWSFTAFAGGTYTFSTCNGFTENTYLRVYNSTGAVLAENDDACGGRSEITWTAPDNGEYNILLTNAYCNVLQNSGNLAYSIATDNLSDACDITVNYTGSFEDFEIPAGISEITFTAKGADGGYGKVKTFFCTPVGDGFVNECLGAGGQGATVTATFNVGTGPDSIPLGSTIRSIVGGAGQSRLDNTCGGLGIEWGGGGGGTGVLYRPPGSCAWNFLVAAGGGGGGAVYMVSGVCVDEENGGGGLIGTSGGSGGGAYILGDATFGYGGSNGEGGFSHKQNGRGGGGVWTPGCDPNYNGGGCSWSCWNGGAGSSGYWAGGGGGNLICNSFSNPSGEARGGYGFGGGGAGVNGGGGGGGGYSGGGGGYVKHSGGGGGSYISPMATSQSAVAGGSTGYPTNGFVSTVCVGSLFSNCPADVTLNTDPGQSFATATLTPPTLFQEHNALNFDGVNDGITLTTTGLPAGNGPRTLEARIRTTQPFAALVSFGGFGFNQRFALYVSGGALHFVGEGNDHNSGVPVNDGQWHHVAATYGSGSLKLYLDGALVLTQATTFNTVLSQFSIGHKNTPFPVEYYQGDIQEVRVWNIARSQAQISTYMASELTLPQSGLVAYYTFDQGIPGGSNPAQTALIDALAVNAGTLSNFALSGSTSNWVLGNMLVGNAPSTFPIGNTTVSWTAFDAQGEASTCSQTVTVIDDELPVMTCAPDMAISTGSGLCQPQVVLSEPTVSDNGHPSSNALDFDGQDDYVDLGNVTETNFGLGDFTIEFWMKTESMPSGPQAFQSTIISKRSICDCSNFWNIILRVDGKLRFEISEAACAKYFALETGQSVNDGLWHHIAVTREDGELKFHIDGYFNVSATPGFTSDLSNSDPLQIGKSACSDSPFGLYYEGRLDEVRIWDDARSEFEILNYMNAVLGPQPGLVVMHALNEGLAGADNTGIITAVDSSGNGNDGTLINFALVGDGSNWVSRTTAGLSVTNDAPGLFPIGSTTVTWTATDLSGNTATCAQNVIVTDDQAPIISCPDDIILETDPGENYGTTTILPPAATDNCSALGNALNFDGVDDRVTISNPVGSVFTLEAWIRTTAIGNTGTYAYQGDPILWSDVFGGGNDLTFAVLNDKLSFFDGSGDIATNGATVLNDGVWHHVAVVRDGVGGTTVLYVDGIPDGTNSCFNAALTANPNIVIGGNLIDQHHFNGTIDEVRIWSGALSEAQIQINMSRALSAEPGLLASYHFNEGVAGGENPSDTTAFDASGNGNDGTLSGFGLIGPSSNWVDNSEMTFTNDAPATFPIGTTTVTWTATDPSGNASNCQFDVTVNQAVVRIAGSLFLSGAYNEATDNMSDALRAGGQVPLAHPYGVAPFNHAGAEVIDASTLAVTGNDAIVDWVLVELRDQTDPATILHTVAALVQKDGDVVDTSGVDPVSIVGVAPGDYYLAFRHRNHLGVMTAAPLSLSAVPTALDLTNPATLIYGIEPQELRDGVMMLWSGNTAPDDKIRYTGSGNDRDPILFEIGGALPTNVVLDVYSPNDVTLDGKVKYTGSGNDRDVILINIGGAVPTNQRFEQLP